MNTDRSESLEIVQPALETDPKSDPLEADPGLEPPDNATSGTPATQKGYSPSESVFKAPRSAHKKEAAAEQGGGRPRNDGMPPGTAAPTATIKIPRPKFTVFKSDSTNGSQRTKSFYNWWNALPTWARERTILYVYRDWPVLKAIPEGSDDFVYIDKISGEEPLQDDIDLLNRYGCGRYKLMFNEQPGGNLCTAYAYSLGNDMKSYPPTDRRISDIENVDDSHPDNRSYIEFLKMRGTWKKEGEGDMAVATVVDRLLDQNKDLTDKAVKAAQQPVPKNDNDASMRLGMEVVADAAKRSNEIMQNTFEQARQIHVVPPASAAPATPPVDPMEMALRIVALLKEGKDKDDPEIVQLRAQVDQLRNDQVTMLRDELKAMREQMNNTSRVTGNPFASLQEGMKAMRDMRTVVDEISGASHEKGVVEEAVDAVGPKWLGKYAPLIQQGFGLFDSFFRYRAASAGFPMPPGPQPQYPMAPQPGFPPNPQGFPQPQPQPQPQTISAPPLPPGFPPELANLLMRISRSLHYHLADINATGSDFASWFMSGEGDETYAEVQSFGVEGIIRALQSFPVTAQIVNQFPIERLQLFVTEFVTPQFDDEDKGDEETPAGPVAVEEPPKDQPA